MKRVLFLSMFAAASLFLNAQGESVTYKPVEYPDGFTSQLNVVYTRVDDWEGKMDLYIPPRTGKATPVVINIHGGGWNKGVKESQTGFNTFFKAGFAVANVEYRLTGQATAPAAIEDVRCALIYLIKNARQLNIDVNKIVVMGGSAGGHLALMAGLLENDSRFDANCKGVAKVKVAAIINKYGIPDVSNWALKSKSAVSWLGAQYGNREFAKSVSPIFYVKKSSPPVFIVHGDADPIVPYQESVALHKKLVEEGVTTRFITVEGGEHGKFTKEKNSELNKEIIGFLKKVGVIE